MPVVIHLRVFRKFKIAKPQTAIRATPPLPQVHSWPHSPHCRLRTLSCMPPNTTSHLNSQYPMKPSAHSHKTRYTNPPVSPVCPSLQGSLCPPLHPDRGCIWGLPTLFPDTQLCLGHLQATIDTGQAAWLLEWVGLRPTPPPPCPKGQGGSFSNTYPSIYRSRPSPVLISSSRCRWSFLGPGQGTAGCVPLSQRGLWAAPSLRELSRLRGCIS